jgi:hypothetical protein
MLRVQNSLVVDLDNDGVPLCGYFCSFMLSGDGSFRREVDNIGAASSDFPFDDSPDHCKIFFPRLMQMATPSRQPSA